MQANPDRHPRFIATATHAVDRFDPGESAQDWLREQFAVAKADMGMP